ncbi:hypothetical protein [Streptomyces sp. WAC06614]|uniref:hypothetical protein n=1 Tax=Streptomyces sp. WAC06614 TaxID=2487416 RepID=UPI000F781132|nr:hypothetical protein [Streptomyces sp. WAC06614]RSS56313.1 hypothetical protein EF918_34225 [Streptomyces sp. WAC06614]
MNRTDITRALDDLLFTPDLDLDEAIDRHTVTLTLTDGRTSRIEVHLFARMAPDGRFRTVEETTRPLTDHPDDEHLGLIH